MTENDHQIEIAISVEDQINAIPGFHDERELYDFDYRRLMDVKRRVARLSVNILLYGMIPEYAESEKRQYKLKRMAKLRDILKDELNKLEENEK